MINISASLSRLRYWYYFRKFASCGENVRLSRNGFIARPEEIEIGSHVFISTGFRISAKNIRIGNYVMMGPNMLIECTDHKYNKAGLRMFEYQEDKKIGELIIEDDVWIGANVTILKNVRIAEGAVIGACCLVEKDIPPYTINVGVPARPIKTRFSNEELKRHLSAINSAYSYTSIVKRFGELNLL